MIIDCHAHYEPRMLRVESMLAKMDQAGVDRVVLVPAMNDIFPHIPESLLTLMRTLMNSPLRPVARAVHWLTLTGDGHVKVGGRKVSIYPQPDNQSVAQLVELHPQRLQGWIFLNPAHDPQVLDTLERWRGVPGMIGVKLHPHWHEYKTRLLDPLLARCQELNLPVLIHLGFGKHGDYRHICSTYPKLKLICAHAGFPFYKELWRYAADCPNLYVDLSSPYIDEKLANRAVKAMGPERCLYGTDAPYGFEDNDGYNYAEIKGWIERMPLPPNKAEAILGSNFLRICH